MRALLVEASAKLIEEALLLRHRRRRWRCRFDFEVAVHTLSSRGVAGLSTLSVWWHKLGIRHERIDPGHPEQNGRHENGDPLSLRIASGSPYSSKTRCRARLTTFVFVLVSATIAMMNRLYESVIVNG